ncbi:MAG TPA: hypothetical protein VFE90_07455 [Myxococcales bacterium]|nr:hypothetical protein [Myxococcales bacterium]
MAGFAVGIVWVVATLLLSRLSSQVDLLRFPIAWAGVLVALDGLARWRRGLSPLRSPADWVAAAVASVVFWDVFELVNLRLHNWWYAGVSPSPWAGGLFAAASFATVLPAVRLGLAQLPPGPQWVAAIEARRIKLLAGLAALALALAFPRFAFPLAFIFLWPICEALAGVRVRLRVMALGLPLGLVWESLNWRCARGWSYTIPFFERPKLFEMPLPGYLGYLPFALEAVAALALLDKLRPHLRGKRAAPALIGVLLFHALAEHLGRGQTVLSFSR